MTRKLIDGFPFLNTFEILKLRLEILAPYVDHFVLIESTHTYSGKPKPLYYKKNPISGYKIEYVVTEPVFAHEVDEELAMRNQEAQVRQGYGQATQNLDASDILLMSDIDEIPRPSKLRELDLDQPAIFEQEWYIYWLNCKTNWKQWGTSRVPLSMAQNDFWAANMYRWTPREKMNIIKDGGWHFSYFGGQKVIQEKLGAVQNAPLRAIPLEEVEWAMMEGKGLETFQGPTGIGELETDLPDLVLDNLDKYQHWIHPDYRNAAEKKKYYESVEQRRQRRLIVTREIDPARHKTRITEDPVYREEYA